MRRGRELSTGTSTPVVETNVVHNAGSRASLADVGLMAHCGLASKVTHAKGVALPDVGLVYIESHHGPRRVRMMGPQRAGCNLAAKMMGMLVMSAYVGTAAGSPLNSQRSAGWSLRLRGGSADADLAPA